MPVILDPFRIGAEAKYHLQIMVKRNISGDAMETAAEDLSPYPPAGLLGCQLKDIRSTHRDRKVIIYVA